MDSFATVRLTTYFPFAITDRRRPAWTQEEIDTLLRSSSQWRIPHADDDLGLQPYGTEILDQLVATMPTALLELVGYETLAGLADLAAEDRRVLHNPGEALEQ